MNKQKLILIAGLISFVFLMTIFAYSSAPKNSPSEKNVKYVNFDDEQMTHQKVYIVVIDSCEYLYTWFGMGNGGAFTHKGNCKFCKERKEK